jgi:hypothetical protein
MSNVIFLTADDFYVDKGTKGPIMCNNISGICFVLFHANPGQCAGCDETVPEFKKVSQIINNCKFGLCNISRNQQVLRLSGKTIAPIEYVPYMLLYYNGRPIARYDGEERGYQDLAEFVQEMAARLQSKKNFIENKGYKFDSDIAIYGGIPFNVVCDEDKGVCYLTSAEVTSQNQPFKKKL